jgi:riboflavin biosynthesis pyrimidine reductase
MVASIDGSTVLHGVSRALSSDTDREVLLTLRSIADVIVVGAGTVRAEGYGVPKKPGQRIGVVSHRGNVDLSIPLFASGAAFLIVPEDAPARDTETVRAGIGEVDLVAAMHKLPGNPRFVQVEGGPSLNGALAAADLIDEINITTSPLLAGGSGPRATTKGPELGTRFILNDVFEDDSFLFSRYRRSQL